MKLQIDQSAEPFRQGLEELLKEKGHCIDNQSIGSQGVLLRAECTASGSENNRLTVEFSQGTAVIYYSRKAHFYRGVMHLLMHLEECGRKQEADFKIEETVYFEQNGAMLDCSRNGVLNLDTIKKYIRFHASLGLNTMMLYTEDTYEVENEPYFGAFRGRYTQEELRECDAYAQLFGIELIPCIQTLAHLRTMLRWKDYRSLKDIDDILLTGSEAVYALLDKMIHSLSEAFGSRRIHLGMDEAHSLGLGKYLDQNGYRNRFEIMKEHLNRVNEICRKYHLEPMIWSDMYFRLQSPTGDYYDLPENTEFPENAMPPENITLVYWDYYQDREEHYRNYFRLHRKLGSRTAFAGGAWTWNGIAPNIAKMYAASAAALKVCREEKIKQTVCTFWQDNGAETPLAAGDMALVLFAEYGFCREPDKGNIRKWLDYLRGEGTYEGCLLLDRFDHLPGTLRDNANADNPSKYLFYQDVLLGLFDEQIKGFHAGAYYQELAADLERLLEKYPDSGSLFVYYKLLAQFLAEKAELGMRITGAYRTGNLKQLKHLRQNVLGECLFLLEEIRRYREELWFDECRPFGYEVLDIRLGGLKARLESAERRLGRYLDGELSILEELEETRLVYDRDTENPGHTLCSVNLWENIVSAGNAAGV